MFLLSFIDKWRLKAAEAEALRDRVAEMEEGLAIALAASSETHDFHIAVKMEAKVKSLIEARASLEKTDGAK